MKKLNEVTLEDAKEIIKAGYPHWFDTGTWKLEDRSKDLLEQCSLLYSRHKGYKFWFMNNCIDIDYNDCDHRQGDLYDDLDHADVRVACYVKAHSMGYHVPQFNDIMALFYVKLLNKLEMLQGGMMSLEDYIGEIKDKLY